MSTKNYDKNILLCVAGMTPQIVTETLYAITQDKTEPVKIDQIKIITTLTGRDKIVKELLDVDNGQFYKFCNDYKIDPLTITFREEDIILLVHDESGTAMDDIRTTDDNDKAANQICEIVRSLTLDNNTRIFASIAGGRKTMSVYLTMGMQLYGRSWDRLSHVLVNKEFEALSGKFYYIPPTPTNIEGNGPERKILSTADAKIELAPIPFLRLREIVNRYDKHRNSDLANLVLRTQSDLDLLETPGNLVINLKNLSVTIRKREATMTDLQMSIYLLFALYRKGKLSGNKTHGWRSLNQILKSDLEYVCRMLTKANGEEMGLHEIDKHSKSTSFFASFALVAQGPIIDSSGYLSKTFSEANSKLRSNLEAGGIPEIYYLSRRKGENSATYEYALDIDPESIIIV